MKSLSMIAIAAIGVFTRKEYGKNARQPSKLYSPLRNALRFFAISVMNAKPYK